MNYLAWTPGVKIKEVRIAPITTGTQPISGGYLLRAGTPLSNAYVVKNDSNAKYIVAEDYIFYMADPGHNTDPVKLIEAGYVDLAKAEYASGLTYASGAKNALKSAGIFLLTGDEANVSSTTYTRPTASGSTLGGVKIGDGLTISSGKISVNMRTPAANQAASTAADVAGIVADFNTLLGALKTAGLMAADT